MKRMAAHELVVKPLRLPAGIFLFGIRATSACLPEPFFLPRSC